MYVQACKSSKINLKEDLHSFSPPPLLHNNEITDHLRIRYFHSVYNDYWYSSF